MNWSSLWRSLSKSLLLLTFFLPFVVMRGTVFPTIFAKSIFYRSLIDASLICLAVYVLITPKAFFEELRERFSKKNPVLIAFTAYIAAVALSTIFAHNPYVAFWGQLSRDEGFIMYLHLLLFVVSSFLLFEKEDWKLYVGGFIASSAVVSLGAWIQFLGGSLSFPLELKAESQPGSFIGNPAFLGSFMIAMGALFTLYFDYKKFTKKWLYLGILILIVSTVIITGIRGAFLGLCAGLLFALVRTLFSKETSRKLKAIIGIVLIAGTLLVGTFIATRSHPFWLSIPTVRRFATLNYESNSLKSRLSSWETGLKGFANRPIFGWGPEGFRYVMNNYGDPTDAAYTDDWVDRAHNKVIDIAAMQGIFGLITYLAVMGILVWVMRKNELFCAFLVAYFVQNLFVFDSPVSYAVFAGITALCAYNYHTTQNSTSTQPTYNHLSRKTKVLTQGLAILIIVAITFSTTFANVLPLLQQRHIKELLQGTTVEAKFGNLDGLLYPFTPVQLDLRPMLVERMIAFGSHVEASQLQYFKKAVTALEQIVQKDPDDPHIHLALTNAYAEQGINDASSFVQAEKYAREAVAFAPYQQKFYYILSYILFRTGKIEESIATAQKAVDMAPNVGKSYLYLALPLIGSGKEAQGVEALKKMASIASIKKDGTPATSYNDYRDTQYTTFDVDELMNAIVLCIKAKEYITAFNLSSLGILQTTNSGRTVSLVQYRLVTGVLAQNAKMVSDTLNIISNLRMKVPFSVDTLREYTTTQNWEALRKEPALNSIIREFGN